MYRDYVYKSQDIVNEVKKAVIGKDDVVTKVMLAVLARGHVVLEDIPGVGKTTLAVAKMARANAYYLGREYVVPDDVRAVLKATAGHRVLLTSKAGVAGLTGGDILEKILEEIEPPSIQQPARPRRDR